MKARRVKGIDPDAPFIDNARRILGVRRAELEKLAAKALEPGRAQVQHDTRIAAKRLRYLYEITEPCFGDDAKRGAKAARGLQDVLGEIHDCDVMSARIRARADAIPVEDERYIGFEALASYFEARRRVLHRQFVKMWADIEL